MLETTDLLCHRSKRNFKRSVYHAKRLLIVLNWLIASEIKQQLESTH